MRLSLCALLFATAFLEQSARAQTSYSYVSVTYPGAKYTWINGIDSAGNTVGSYQMLASSLPIGFVRLANGELISLPGPAGAEGSEVNGLSDSGVAVGEYFSGTGEIISGLIYEHGVYKTFNFENDPTDITAISTNNLIVGINEFGGFQGSASGKAQLLPNLNNAAVEPYGINSNGVIVGNDQVSAIKDVRTDGFVLTPDGVYQTLDYPKAWYTYLNGINNSGAVVGSYKLQDYFIGGFVYSKGQFSPIRLPEYVPDELSSDRNQCKRGNHRGIHLVGLHWTRLHSDTSRVVASLPLHGFASPVQCEWNHRRYQ